MQFGYTLASEEFGPKELVKNAIRAEEVGFDFVGISDHFHPWVNAQGQSPFSWSVIGALGQVTKRVDIFVEVVCPFMRYHPAIVAQAAATSQLLSDGRFVLGLGSGENLNEHITGEGWPHVAVRQAMLREAIEAIQRLLTGEQISYYGNFVTVEEARIYSLPDTLPPIIISAFGPKAARIAGEMGDGLVSTAPKTEIVQTFEKTGGQGKPKYAQIDVCFAEDVKEAQQIAFRQWPNAGANGQLTTELRLPAYFEQATSILREEQVVKQITCGSKLEEYLKIVDTYQKAGYDRLYFHNIGPHQTNFLQFAQNSLLPALRQI